MQLPFLCEGYATAEDEEARWRRLEKWEFRLRRKVQGLILDQITLLLDELKEAQVRVDRQKERFSKEQDCPPPPPQPPVLQVSGRSGKKARRRRRRPQIHKTSVAEVAASVVPSVSGVAGRKVSGEQLEEERKRHKKMFEMLEKMVEHSNWRPLQKDAVDPFLDLDAAVRQCWISWLETPRSSAVNKKACLVPVEEMMAFPRVKEWITESCSFAKDLAGAVSDLCSPIELMGDFMGWLNVDFDIEDCLGSIEDDSDVDDYLHEEEDGSSGSESEELETEVSEDDTAELNSEGGQGQGSVSRC